MATKSTVTKNGSKNGVNYYVEWYSDYSYFSIRTTPDIYSKTGSGQTNLSNALAELNSAIVAYKGSSSGSSSSSSGSSSSSSKGSSNSSSTNGGSSSTSSTSGSGTVIVSEVEMYKGYPIRKGIRFYGQTYQVDCNTKDADNGTNKVGYDAPHGYASSESAARSILNQYVTEAKKAIDNYVAGQSSNQGGSTTDSGDTQGQSILSDVEMYRGYPIRKGIYFYGKTYQVDCNTRDGKGGPNEVGYEASPYSTTDRSAADAKLNQYVAEAKKAIDNYIASQGAGAGSAGGNETPAAEQVMHDIYPSNGYNLTRTVQKEYWTDGSGKSGYAAYANCKELGFSKQQAFPTEQEARNALDGYTREFEKLAAQASGAGNTEEGNNNQNNTQPAEKIYTDTVESNGYTARRTIQKEYRTDGSGKSGYAAYVNCNELGFSRSQAFPTEQEARNAMEQFTREFEQKAAGAGNTENNEQGDQNTGGAEKIFHDTYPSNGYEAIRTIQIETDKNGVKNYATYVKCDELGFMKKGGFMTEAEARKALDDFTKQFEQAASGNGNTEGNTTSGIDDGSSLNDKAPYPAIVFGDKAEVSGGAGVNYQQARNKLIASMIYEQMRGKTYNSADEAFRDFCDKLMSIVNSNGGKLQIGADGTVSGDNAKDWANTISLIKQYLFADAGVSSWGGFAGNDTGNGNSADTEWKYEDIQSDVTKVSDKLLNDLDAWKKDSLAGFEAIAKKVGNYSNEIKDRLNTLGNTFNTAAKYLSSANDLMQKAQRIYSNQNIQKMNNQLRQMGFNAAQAAPAVYYQVGKQMANVAIEYYKLEGQQQEALANLEMQRAQLIDNIKAAGIEADQWSINMLASLEQQIQEIKNNWFTQRATILGQYQLQPMIDVMSNTFQAELDAIVAEYQAQYLDANPEMRGIFAQKVFGSDYAYLDAAVALNTSGTFAQYLARCAESIRANKVKAEKEVAEAGATVYGNKTINEGSGTTTKISVK